MSSSINTVTGTITPDQLGWTLMHEHVFVEYNGPSPDFVRPGPRRDEIIAICTGYIEQIRAFNVATLVDPTTVDLGRNAVLLAEIAAQTGFNIICATGIYSPATYVRLRAQLGGSPDAVAGMFIKELTDGIDNTGIKAGIIKVVTGGAGISREEHELLLASAKASVVTGAPIITHTEGILGDEQQRILTSAGVPAQRIIIGHSCLSRNFDYHRSIVQGGSYLAFDRFGMPDMPDEVRAASMIKLIDAGCAAYLMVSHDSVWYWVDGPTIGIGAYKNWVPTNFFERVIPMLHYGGATDEQLEMILRENPKRFFSGRQIAPIKQP
jgi:phosphotriesterase-related protein